MISDQTGQRYVVAEPMFVDFLTEWAEAERAVGRLLIELETEPGAPEALDSLFRALHSMKSNLHRLQLAAPAQLLHSLEDLLGALRCGAMQFSPLLSDLLLLSVEMARKSFTAAAGNAAGTEGLMTVARLVQLIVEDGGRREDLIVRVLGALDPLYRPRATGPDPRIEKEVSYFRALAQASEVRAGLEPGAMARMELTALELNRLAGSPLTEAQLSAAVLLHDFGMSAIPRQVFESPAPLPPATLEVLRRHPLVSAALLELQPEWQEARRIILQHHERFDGGGYPLGLAGADIHPGAALIAIIDTFEAMVQQRAYKSQRRPVLRALAEINAESGRQFDPHWVEVFNAWVRLGHAGQRPQ
jgi:HPt (histidine-containing phosphotransfer) domain-containing protein